MANKITVLMPVYNGKKYLREAIESILEQTFADFRFLIINDGSTDNSEEIIKGYKDSRIRFLKNEKNLGLISTLNIGLKEANGKYIARMDQDDISFPNRLKLQYQFMESNPEIGISGTWIKKFGIKKSFIGKYYTTHDDLAAYLLFGCPFAHPTVIMRNEVMKKNGLFYDLNYQNAEDIALWSQSVAFTKLANLPKVLLYYRTHPNTISRKYTLEQYNAANKVKLDLLKNINLFPTDEELKIHSSFVDFDNDKKEFLNKTEVWLIKIIGANKKSGVFNNKSLNKIISNRWLNICLTNANFGLYVWKKFWSSDLSREIKKNDRLAIIKLFIKCLIKNNINIINIKNSA